MVEKKDLKFGKILGIDLGTTNSVITVWDGDKQQYIPIPSLEGEPIVPSAVFIREGKVRVGQKAREELKSHPENTVLSVKSHMDNPKYRFELKNVTEEGGSYDFSPVDISSNILKYIKKSAEEYVGDEIKDVVITVPAYYREVERKSTARAAEKAGLNVIEIINEPTSACLAYGYANSKDDEDKRILVYDLGGGTFDVTLLEMSPDFYEVVATDGDKLGGDDLDLAFLEYIKKKISIGKATEKQAKFIVEEAKKQLTDKNKIVVDFTEYGGETLEVTRNQFEKTVMPLVKRTIGKIEGLLALHGEDVDEVVLVGGSTKSPIIKKELIKVLKLSNDYFDKYTVDPDLAVSVGACIRGRILLGDTDIILIDKTPFDLGIELHDGRLDALIHRGSVIPTVGSDIYQNEVGISDVKFRIYQGNDIIAKNNQYLGQMDFTVDLTLLPVVSFKVDFSLDTSGLLTVAVTNLSTMEKKEVTVTGVTD